MANAKNIVIGGIAGGIGSALARRLHKNGHTVVGYGRDSEKLEALQSELEGVQTAVCDATDAEALDTRLKQFADDLGSIDAYVHAVGSIYLKPAHQTPVEEFAKTIELNLYSAFYALRTVAGRMQKQGHGNCLFFSTAAARAGIANHESIAAAKGGIEALVRSAASTYSSRHLRFNAIAPSLTDTAMSEPITKNEKALEFSKLMHPLGDIAYPDDVASLAEWLLSDNARFVTGQVYVVDGGVSSIVPKPKV